VRARGTSVSQELLDVKTLLTTGTNTGLKIRIKKSFGSSIKMTEGWGYFVIRNLHAIAARWSTSLNFCLMALKSIFTP
jgi:hypothetical protein